MGTRNKERRAAKARQRARERSRRTAGTSHRHGGSAWDDAWFRPADHVPGLFDLATLAAVREDHDVLADVIAALARADRRRVHRHAEARLGGAVSDVWTRGWQPGELVRHLRRADARAGRLAAVAVAVDHAERPPASLHPRWAAQVEALGVPTPGAGEGWLAAYADAEGLDALGLVTTVVVALSALRALPPLPTILPPPGQTSGSTPWATDLPVDDPVLVKVRALLAQAESTTFEAEAEAFTAKAQELMARHAIDAARIWAGGDRDERPTTVRLPIDDPYADIKSLLLQCVAHRSRCRAVHHLDCALSSVVGFASDVAATEMLFTSLLVQSQAALQAESARCPPGGRERSRSFRSSFLLAFTQRVDQRLAEITTAAEAAARGESGTGESATGAADALLPVLRARTDAVDDAVKELFGDLVGDPVRGGRDAAGWARGRLAADLAQLSFADLQRHEPARRPAPAVDQLPVAGG